MFDFIRSMARRGWPFRVLDPFFGRYNPFHPAFIRDPYPVYRRLREEAPFYHHPLLRTFVLSRHEDITKVLKSSQASTVIRPPPSSAPTTTVPHPATGDRG